MWFWMAKDTIFCLPLFHYCSSLSSWICGTYVQAGVENMHKDTKYVLFLDDDVRLHPGSIGALTAEMEKKPEVCEYCSHAHILIYCCIFFKRNSLSCVCVYIQYMYWLTLLAIVYADIYSNRIPSWFAFWKLRELLHLWISYGMIPYKSTYSTFPSLFIYLLLFFTCILACFDFYINSFSFS